MAITADRESIVRCPDCGEPAVRRELRANGQFVSYDTHSADLLDIDHLAALGRMRAFYDRLLAIEREIKKRPFPSELGIVRSVDFEPLRPSACAPRREIVTVVLLRAFGRNREVRLQSVDIDELSVDGLAEELVPLLAAAAREMRAEWEREFEQGRF
ncbi:MAG: hypothetical protein L0229_20205 [Blastocatellia bacterium]|nr:hypothetical protein [Blastocatellia bacterium]